MMDDFLESEEFYNAMQAYRHAPLDGQERVIECFEEVKSMVRAELAQQAVVIEQMREALKAMVVCAREEGKGLRIADEALALQPSPEVLNKVRADAVREAAKWVGFTTNCNCNLHMMDFAQRIEKGEA
jgi:hypothetical protein